MVTFWTCLGNLSIFCAVIVQVSGINRTFYIGIQEENWNYAPSGHNLIIGKPIAVDEYASVFLQRGPRRIGSVYKKAIYKQYTDASYSQEIPKPTWLGYLGPILRAEVNDVIIVHLKNFASRRYSMHPHGVFYAKDSEGALYPDGTSDTLKKDDGVPPGGNYTYIWTVKPDYAPQKGDANCLTWAYHSHVSASQDISSGLIGALLTCKKGTLRTSDHNQNQRADVDQELVLMFSVVDENSSWYLKENIQAFCSDPYGVDPAREDFQESNMMHAINGYMYGNLPGTEFCQNHMVALHLFGMGNEIDIHSVYFHGHTLLDRGHRVDVLSLFSATFATAEMVPATIGTWLLSCQVNDHLKAGMQALFKVSSCKDEMNSTVHLSGKIRKYFIAAEKIRWDYAPSGMDKLTNESLTKPGSVSEMFFGMSGGRLGGKYWKVVYREYTDKSFTLKRKRTSAEAHLGILGPILRAEVGDTLQVMFMNKADRIYSIQPHGLHYDKPFEGVFYQDGIKRKGYQVQPGERFTYRWQLREGPSESDPPCISYLYFSSSDPVRDTNSGLIGPLLVCKKDALDSNGAQKDINLEFFLLFTVFDENLSWYLNQNIETYDTNESELENMEFWESNKMHAVNGFMYGNLPGLEMNKGSKVRWHLMGLGTEMDMHGIYFQGNTFQRHGTTRDTLGLFPHTTVTVSMQPDVSGVFEVSCLVSDHYVGGMRQLYRVMGSEDEDISVLESQIIEYFICAEEVEWDYSPDRTWELQNFNTTEDNSPGSLFVGTGKNRLGSRYKKAIYREYTDATFRTRKLRQPQEEHLEILGPIIQAEVGQVLLITFMNKASHPYSIQAHGVRTSSKPEAVMSGNMTQYRWIIPVKSGPGVSDPNCIAFAYRSAVDFVKDTASGLIGPLIICRRGVLDQDRQRMDVDREFALLFMVFDENKSWYLEENIQSYYNSSEPLLRDAEFQKSNKMYGINGKLYANLHGLEMVEGERVIWYLFGMGNEADIHTVHFHAETFTYKADEAHRTDVYDLIPGSFQTLEMVAEVNGTWLLHCHVANHIRAGMETTFIVKPRSGGGRVRTDLSILCFLLTTFMLRLIC
ncbi:hephaestin-like protein 1 [Sinocyclocheilus anshuiensis]|uniref:hephaestin-like protein 1 n=1 Tax=Sinocyclocheilus anshuiensis TaxID=1608454 RepID=UPI0007BA4214|nr:PREDICTED: hephaestin-like protein 1 [Sinocyclocheilus anshuiensis]